MLISKGKKIFMAMMVLAVAVSGCTGNKNSSNAVVSPTQIGSEAAKNGKKKLAKLVGTQIVASSAIDDQQNPVVLFLPDKNIYFSVWEDYRNRNTSGADIFGQFINTDGSLCGSPFAITTAAGNQTTPTAAYSQKFGKIVVSWQDTRGDTTGGFVFFAPITNLPTGGSCGAVAPTVGAETRVGFNSTELYFVTVNHVLDALIATANGASRDFGGSLGHTNIVLGSVKITDNTGQTIAADDALGKLTGSATGTINYQTGAIAFSFPVTSPFPANGTQYFVSYDFNQVDHNDMGDVLQGRRQPKIAYDQVRDRFWLVWRESRTATPDASLGNNSVSVMCFNVAPASFNFPDSNFGGYVTLDGNSLAQLTNANGVAGADIIRTLDSLGNLTLKNRLVSRSTTANTDTFTFEFFDNLDNLNVATDTNNPAALLVWEGNRQKETVTCSIQAGGITAVAVSSPFDDGKVHIYGLFDTSLTQKSTSSLRVDGDNTSNSSNYPVTAFDPITNRFLVAWEDLRGGPNTKIFGQLIFSNGGLYNNNKIISFQDTDGDGTQDPNVANSRQTRPFITYDSSQQRYFVAWQDGRNGEVSLENLDIFGQYVNGEGTLSGTNYAIATSPGSQLSPTVAYNSATDANGKQFLALWKDARNSDTDIFGQRFSLGMPQMTLLKTDNTSLAPGLIDFGNVTANQTGRFSFKVKNTGDATLAIDCVNPTPAAPFSFENLPTELQNCNEGQFLNLVPSAETTLNVKFLPTGGGTFTGSFVLNSDAGNSTVNLTGVGVPPTMNVTEGDGSNDGTLEYSLVQNGQSKDLTLTLANNSSVAYNITNIVGPSGAFSLVNPPAFPIAMATNGTTTLTIRFSPTADGPTSSQLTINTDKSLSSTINLSGTGSATAPVTPGQTPSVGGGTATAAPSSGGKSGCFIATAAYGSYLDPHVMVLRHFRDDVLLKSRAGSAFVRLYYHYSPPIADFISRHNLLRVLTRWALTPLIFAVKYPGFSGIVFMIGCLGVAARQRVRGRLPVSE